MDRKDVYGVVVDVDVVDDDGPLELLMERSREAEGWVLISGAVVAKRDQ